MNTIPPYCKLDGPATQPMAEFVMRLDSTLAKTHQVPINPSTGKVWTERAQRLCFLETVLAYESEVDPKWEEERNRLMEGLEWRERPLFMEEHLLLGANYAGAVVPRMFRCHPETWAGVSEELKKLYEVVPEEGWRIKFP